MHNMSDFFFVNATFKILIYHFHTILPSSSTLFLRKHAVDKYYNPALGSSIKLSF